jgi:hypothetical protein
MDQKSIMLTRRRMNELASSHNKLTTLVACLLNEINSLKKELHDATGNGSGSDNSNTSTKTQTNTSNSSNSQNGRNPNRFPNFNELRADEILKQLTINTNDN